MTRRIPDCRLRWIRHCHFASRVSLSGELRLVRMAQDDQQVPTTSVGDQNKQNKESILTPEERALRIREKNLGTETTPEKLLDEVRRAKQEEELEGYLSAYRDKILLTAKGKEGVWRLMKLLDGEIPGSSEDIHRVIEEIFAKKQKPEEDRALTNIMEETRADLAKLESGEQKKSRWELFLESIAELQNPLYTRLADFLGNPAIASESISMEDAFEALQDPPRRLELIQKLAGQPIRHALTMGRAIPLETRYRAAHDLFAFLRHCYPLLSSEERAILYDRYCRVSACIAVLDQERVREAGKKGGSQQKFERAEYHAKRDSLRSFLAEDEKLREKKSPGWMGTSEARESLIERLRRSDDPIFRHLLHGLAMGGWIAELHLSRAEEYLFTRITLSEMLGLYGEIAKGEASGDPDSVLHTLRLTFFGVVRRSKRGEALQQKDSAVSMDLANPLREAQELERRIQEKFRETKTVTNAEVDELLLLIAWIEGMGIPYPLGKEERKHMQTMAEKGFEQVQSEAERAREALQPLAESSTVRLGVLDLAHSEDREREKERVNELLLSGDTKSLISAFCALHEEERIFLDPKRRMRHADWESPILHEGADARYQAKLREIRERYGIESEAERELNRRYDEENAERQELYTVELERWQLLLIQSLEAEVRLKARELREEYEKKLEALGAQERFPEVRGLDCYAFFEEREQTFFALHTLETIAFHPEGEVAASAEAALAELDDLAGDIADPIAAVKERMQELKDTRRNAKEIIMEMHGRLDPASERMFQEYAQPDAPIGSVAAMKGMKVLGKNPELVLLAERHNREMEEYQRNIQARHTKRVIPRSTSPESLEGRSAYRGTKHAAEVEALREKSGDAFAKMQDVLQRYPDECGFAVQIEREEAEAAGLLSIAKAESPASDEATWKIAEASWIIARIEQATGTLQRIHEREPEMLSEERFAALAQEHRFSPGARAAFIPEPHGSERIVLNAERVRNPQMQRLVTLAERAHALHHVLSEFYPTFFAELHDDLAKDLPTDLQGTFTALAEKWVPRTKEMTDMDWKTEVADECMEKRLMYRTFRAPGSTLSREDTPLSPEEFAFFEALDRRGINPLLLHAGHLSMRPRHRGFARMSNGEDDMGADDIFAPSAPDVGADRGPAGVGGISGGRGRGNGERSVETPGEGGNGDYVETSTIPQDFDDARIALVKIKAFLESNPDHGPDSADNRAYVRELEEEHERLKKEFLSAPHAEADKDLQRRIRQLKDDCTAVADAVATEDQRREDLRKVPPATRGLRALWQDVRWLSVYDVIRIFKDIGEDIKRQHNRRQEGKIGQIGEAITSWIPQWVPYLGNLHHDFHERQQKAELDEVEHFKKGLANIDAYEIQLMTHHTRNKDHLKACITELTDRGRMNWNDTEMWRTFNALSRYKMPVKDCERNENLKEAWLRKVISDIWSDKDLYRNWKRKNDDTFSSKMKEYTYEADRLSNLKGGLAGELEKQLRVYTEIKDEIERTGKHIPMDEIIRRDLFMEVIEYSIRNGKMSMEDKLFYLVQGLASGLLPLDRLRILAGEKGEILNIFPFIDYFYGRNNTLSEIQALADRLRETTNKKDDMYYRPGLKTTLWLELEVIREEHVQQRLRKGAYRKAAEMDHDDMHFFMPRLDYKTLDSMATPQGGGRQQVTADGWMNAYSGYNSFFKSFGILSKLEEDTLDMRFTSQDADQVIQAVAGFVRLDGILTRRAAFDGAKDRRPGIPWSKMRTTKSVVSDGSKTIYEEREVVDAFMKELLMDYGYEKQVVEDALISTEENPNPTPDQEKAAIQFSNMLDADFTKRVRRDGTAKMKKVLKKFMPQFSAHAISTVIGGESRKYSYEEVKKIKEEELRQKKAKLAPVQAPPRGH